MIKKAFTHRKCRRTPTFLAHKNQTIICSKLLKCKLLITMCVECVSHSTLPKRQALQHNLELSISTIITIQVAFRQQDSHLSSSLFATSSNRRTHHADKHTCNGLQVAGNPVNEGRSSPTAVRLSQSCSTSSGRITSARIALS
jgi:hypothetical protein